MSFFHLGDGKQEKIPFPPSCTMVRWLDGSVQTRHTELGIVSHVTPSYLWRRQRPARCKAPYLHIVLYKLCCNTSISWEIDGVGDHVGIRSYRLARSERHANLHASLACTRHCNAEFHAQEHVKPTQVAMSHIRANALAKCAVGCYLIEINDGGPSSAALGQKCIGSGN